MRPFSNLASVVFKRTYSRKDTGVSEKWEDTVDRAIAGNIRGHNVSDTEVKRLKHFFMERKAMCAGRGLWTSGTPIHDRIGGAALNNCWFFTADNIEHFVVAQDLLMLGGGVGLSVEREFVSKLPRVKRGVSVVHKNTKDADFIVPDSREGWCDLLYRMLNSFFVDGKSFTYSTVCLRPHGEPIKGFGGVSSGAEPLIKMIEKISAILVDREGKAVRPIDAADIICSIGEMVVAGNVRRSAIIILGDSWDKEYLKAKRWDLGPVPTQRSKANFSIVAEDPEHDLRPLFWATYKQGEPFGIVNRANIQKFGRIGDIKKDSAVGVNPCVPAGTRILTKEGYQNIETLVGKSTDVWNGFEWSTVIPKVTGYNQPLVKVTLSSGQSLVCTTAHKWAIKNKRSNKFLRVKASDLKIGQKLINTQMPVVEGTEKMSVDPYTQGFYAGDGTKNSKELLDKTFVPMKAPVSERLEWLAGLIDSDGCIASGTIQISSINKSFLLAVQLMLTTLGVKSKVCQMHSAGEKTMPHGDDFSTYFCQESFRLLINGAGLQHLNSIGLDCTRVKTDVAPNRDASRFVTVVSVDPCGVADEVYCFTEGKRNLGTFEGVVTGQCAEATLENGEPCNLQEINLGALSGPTEFYEAARLMTRWGQRVTCDDYHWGLNQSVVSRNRRVGTSVTGCLMAPELFNPKVLDKAYAEIQKENQKYAKELGIPASIRTTVIKPSGTLSKLMDSPCEGIHPAYSQYSIQRVRFSTSDKILDALREAGHFMEPERRFDGSIDYDTTVVDFYLKAPEGTPTADGDFGTKDQLEAVKMAQKHWADQSISVTVYYDKEKVKEVKDWVSENLDEIKTISFLAHAGHGFDQAPKEAITKEQYEELSSKIQQLDDTNIDGEMLNDLECEGGACPVR